MYLRNEFQYVGGRRPADVYKGGYLQRVNGVKWAYAQFTARSTICPLPEKSGYQRGYTVYKYISCMQAVVSTNPVYIELNWTCMKLF